ncbi:hypothetical protein ACFC0D_31295 [Streptomyces sp. NPDC056222]|uniref:hypothetical protein n=1 Tax=Streptomyces sp. NPDC056222 TaxID=3345749 RepID=UPI0035D56E60
MTGSNAGSERRTGGCQCGLISYEVAGPRTTRTCAPANTARGSPARRDPASAAGQGFRTERGMMVLE